MLCVLGLLLAPPARAQCPEGVMLYPSPGAVVPTNTRFLLEGLGSASASVAALVGHKMRLQADDHELTVKAQRGWTSPRGRTTVVLKPSGALKANRLYTLRLDDVMPGIDLLNGQGPGLPQWRSGRTKDAQRPRWLKRPAVSEGHARRGPGGVSRSVKLTMGMREDSSSYLVVTLARRAGDTSPQRYVVPVRGGAALLSDDVCRGAFTLENGRSYTARLELFDAAGNPAPAVAPVRFEAPRAPPEESP